MPRLSRLQPPASALPALGAAMIALSAPAGALAQGCTGAPGASAIQQYCEAVPRADGGSDRPGGGSGPESGSGVSRSTSESLRDAGADGAAVERLAQGAASNDAGAGQSKKGDAENAGSTAGGEDADSGGDGGVLAERVEGPADPSSSPLKAATSAVSSGPTAGEGVVWGLVGLSALGVGAAVLVRRRDRITPPGADS